MAVVSIRMARGPTAGGVDSFAGVDDQVQQDLLKLDGVSEDGWQCLASRDANRNASPLHVVTEKADDIVDERVGVHRNALLVLLAEKCAQPSDDLRRPSDGRGDVGQGFLHRGSLTRSFAQQAACGLACLS